MPYGVSFAAAAAIASSPSEFLGVMRGGSIVLGFVVGCGSSPGTGLRRRGMTRIGERIAVFSDIVCGALREMKLCRSFNRMIRDPVNSCVESY